MHLPQKQSRLILTPKKVSILKPPDWKSPWGTVMSAWWMENVWKCTIKPRRQGRSEVSCESMGHDLSRIFKSHEQPNQNWGWVGGYCEYIQVCRGLSENEVPQIAATTWDSCCCGAPIIAGCGWPPFMPTYCEQCVERGAHRWTFGWRASGPHTDWLWCRFWGFLGHVFTIITIVLIKMI